jgi:endogenous inhibitor of DNA gyrase (YacG/DUF329 family)
MATPLCPRCGGPKPQPRSTGRPATWCSDRCKRAAYEERRAAANGAIAVKIVERIIEQDAHGISDCAERVMASPVACRRVLDHLAEQARTDQLSDPKWDSTVRSLTKLIAAVTPRR